MEGGQVQLKKARIMLIGDGEVGKTSLKKCICGYYPNLNDEKPKLPDVADRTVGIDVDEFIPKGQDYNDWTLNFWDFGILFQIFIIYYYYLF